MDEGGTGGPSEKVQALIHSAQNLQITGGNFTVAGRDVHHHTHFHGAVQDVNILKLVPNFRKIHIATLGRATPGTGVWIFEWKTFLIWLDPDGYLKILWGSGMPGAGKTVLASIIINALEARASASLSPVCVCYIYFRYSDHSKASIRDFLEVLVKQTAERHPSCLSPADELYAPHIREHTQPTEGELLGLLHQFTTLIPMTFYVLDALDEAPAKIRLELVKKLVSLEAKLFITSRPLEAVQAQFPAAHCFPIVAQDRDIELHIDQAISRSPELCKILEGKRELRDDIVSSIKQKSGGMFLHATLQLDALEECTCIYDIREILAEFPAQIEDVYLQTWDRVLSQRPRRALVAQTVLLWVLTASRSMTMEEIRYAVASSPHTFKHDPERLVPEETLLGFCCGLVVLEEESRLVRLVHYTAKDVLRRLILQTFPRPSSHLAAVCMTRLIEIGFQNTTLDSVKALGTVLKATPLLEYAYDHWAGHARDSLDIPDARNRLAHFIAGCRAFPVALSGGLDFDTLGPPHIVAFFNLPLTLADPESFKDPNIATRHNAETPLSLACSQNSQEAVKELLRLPATLVNRADNSGWTPLIFATSYRFEGIVSLLLAHTNTDVNLADDDGWTPFIHAAWNNHESTAALLLTHPLIDINRVDHDGWTALIYAASNGYKGMVALLLSHHQIEVNEADTEGRTALIWAARRGHTDIVSLLLTYPLTDPNSSDDQGWTALISATHEGHEDTVKVLVAHPNVKVNLADGQGRTALTHALEDGAEDLLAVLLAHPFAHVNRVDRDGTTPLINASKRAADKAITLLLAHPDIDVNLGDREGRTPLAYASSHGHTSTVGLLLSQDLTDLHLADKTGFSPLALAARNGHEAVVEALLAHSHSGPMYDSNALIAADDSGHRQIFLRLTDFYRTARYQ